MFCNTLICGHTYTESLYAIMCVSCLIFYINFDYIYTTIYSEQIKIKFQISRSDNKSNVRYLNLILRKMICASQYKKRILKKIKIKSWDGLISRAINLFGLKSDKKLANEIYSPHILYRVCLTLVIHLFFMKVGCSRFASAYLLSLHS